MHSCAKAFERLKTALTSAPVLLAPDSTKPYEVVTDSCKKSIGAVLMQEGRPIAFESRKMIPAELILLQ